MDAPIRYFELPPNNTFAGPLGSNLSNADTLAARSLDFRTHIQWNVAENATKIANPKRTNSTAVSLPRVNDPAANRGWREDSYTRVGQDRQPIVILGVWRFTVTTKITSLSIPTVTFTIIVYAVNVANNVTRELFRSLHASVLLPLGILGIRTWTAAPGNLNLNAGEVLQYELYLTVNNIGTSALTILILEGNLSGLARNFSGVDPPNFILQANVGLSDSAPGRGSLGRSTGVFSRSLAETVTTAERLTSMTAYARAWNDSAPATDFPTHQTAFVRSWQNPAPAVDGLVTSGGVYSRALTEPVAVADALVRGLIVQRSWQDAIGVADDLRRSFVGARSLGGESVGGMGVLDRLLAASRSFSEDVRVTDALMRQGNYLRGLTEGLSVVERWDRQVIQGRNWSDGAPAMEALDRAVILLRSLTDAAPAVDAVAQHRYYGRSLVELLVTADSISGHRSFTRELVESIGGLDLLHQTHGPAPGRAGRLFTLLYVVPYAVTIVSFNGEMLTETDLEVYEGDDPVLYFTALQENPDRTITPFNLTDCLVEWFEGAEIDPTNPSHDTVLVGGITIINAGAGEFSVQLDAATDTRRRGSYVFHIRATKDGRHTSIGVGTLNVVST